MFGTYAAALLVIGASLPIGTAVLALAGRREFSWIAPGLGLALILVLSWWTVRLPGEGITALVAIVVVAIGSALYAVPRLGPSRAELAAALPAAGLTFVAVSLPFAVEGHFGILGTGFNVDMSQHLFVADWMQTPLGPAPSLIQQGYPVGPHALTVATAELGDGNIARAFSGVTIAVPVIAALAALAGLQRLPRGRATVAAALVALPYLVASYVAQGAFKEVLEAAFLLTFAIWLQQLRREETVHRGFGLPAAVLTAGALYAYSGPGLAWLVGTVCLWGLFELVRDRATATAAARAALPGLAVAAVALAVLVGPEARRIADFGGSAGNVANAPSSEAGIGHQRTLLLHAQVGGSDAGKPEPGLDLFDNDLGNLFGEVPPLEVFRVWPSGDFRVEPGDGAIPAAAFYLGALIGAAALAVGVLAAARRRESALLAALAAAVVIWLAAWALSTPYTTAKALQMVAPILTLVAVRGLFDPERSPGWTELREGGPRALAASALALAFAAAAAGSAALALANAPVGPERYTAGFGKLREQLREQPVLLLGPSGQIADRHGDQFYGWELRGSRPICVEPFPDDAGGFGMPAPEGIRFVITLGGKSEAPFTDLTEVSRRRRVALWEAQSFDPDAVDSIEVSPDVPTRCELGLS